MTEVNATGFSGDSDPYPYIGGILGFTSSGSDFATGSYDYAVIGATTATAVHATPATGPNAFTAATGIPEPIQSAIWSLSNGNILTAQWVNSDSSTPKTYIVDSSGILALTGDPTQLQNVLGTKVSVDTLMFVCTQGCAVPASVPEPSAMPLALFGLAVLLGHAKSQRLPG
jgi:hypothetical protein